MVGALPSDRRLRLAGRVRAQHLQGAGQLGGAASCRVLGDYLNDYSSFCSLGIRQTADSGIV